MHYTRRSVLKGVCAVGALATAVAAGLLSPARALAAWNKGAFEAKSAAEAMKALGISNAMDSKDIQIRAPEIAENGAVVPVEVQSNIPGTTALIVLVEKNPFPLAARFSFMEGALPFAKVNLKMGESSPVRVVVAAGGKFYTAAQEVKVTIGGCGG